jgi:hypothetical protein
MKDESQLSQDLEQRLADLTGTLEIEKVELSPEVEEYARAHVRAVQDKLQTGQPVFEADLAFIDNVKLWVMMPENLREEFKSVEQMYAEKPEADERHISLKQWLDLLHVAKTTGNPRYWINGQFKFNGGGRIDAESIFITCYSHLKVLPENLNVEKNLDLTDCTSLVSLPKNLKIGGGLGLRGCISLVSLPENLNPDPYLDLAHCRSLKSLPKKLSVTGILNLKGCASLTSLPEDLMVSVGVFLSDDMCDQVRIDAERLASEGKIGKIVIEKIEEL